MSPLDSQVETAHLDRDVARDAVALLRAEIDAFRVTYETVLNEDKACDKAFKKEMDCLQRLDAQLALAVLEPGGLTRGTMPLAWHAFDTSSGIAALEIALVATRRWDAEVAPNDAEHFIDPTNVTALAAGVVWVCARRSRGCRIPSPGWLLHRPRPSQGAPRCSRWPTSCARCAPSATAA